MRVRGIVLAFALSLLIGPFAAPVSAQTGQDTPPAASSRSPSGANPTAQAPGEQQLLNELRKLEGRITIPDSKAAVLVQPQGRTYQAFHERWLPWIAGIAILGMIALLAIVYLWRGPMHVEALPTGIRVRRFSIFERLNHWMTAVSFVVLAITGLNYIFGKRLLFPLIGPDAFATWSQWAKFIHNAFSWPFILGILFMLAVWLRDNIPDRYDGIWLRQLGGVFSRTHPPARRFNAGQKIVYWASMLLGIAMTMTGIVMLFPFWTLDINGMQTAQYVHAVAGALFTALIIFHMFVGTMLVRGSYEGMSTGEVDLAWARQHHPIWVDELDERDVRTAPPRAAGVPAE